MVVATCAGRHTEGMKSHGRSLLAFTLLVLAVVTLPALAQDAPKSPTPRDSPLPGRQVDVVRGLEHPWGLAFLPDYAASGRFVADF